MTGLILDSSSDTIFLALGHTETREPHVPLFQKFDGAARYGSSLFLLIDSFLQSHSLTGDDLTYIAAGRGPGSYTGTRAAVAAATGISLGRHIPLILFPSLLAFLPSSTGKLGAVLEIKGTTDLYTLFYTEKTQQIDETRLPVEQALSSLHTCDAVASSCKLDLHNVPCAPLSLCPHAATARIVSWVDQKKFSAEKSSGITYLQPIV